MGFKKKRQQDDGKSITSVVMIPALTEPVLKEPPKNDIIRIGYIRKLRGLRKKFFILFKDTSDCPARLDYYDNEKKWKSGLEPKRSIIIKNCFNINRYQKHANTIALYTCDEVFCMVLESKECMEDWLKTLLQLQQGDLYMEDEDWIPKPIFEHIWKVCLVNKGLGGVSTMLGHYYLCLTEKALSLLKTSEPLDTSYDLYGNPCFLKDSSTSNLSTSSEMTYNSFYSYSFHNSTNEPIEFPFSGIRRCGSLNNYIFFETGRATILGPGELWMEVEDAFLANNISSVIMNTMKKDESIIIEEILPREKSRPHCPADDKKRKDYPVYRDEKNRTFNILEVSQRKPEEETDNLEQRSRANSESTNSSYFGVLNRLFHSLRKSNSQSSQNNDSNINASIESGESPPCFPGMVSSLDSSVGSMSADEPEYVNSMSLEALNLINQFHMQPDAYQVFDNVTGPQSDKAYVCMNPSSRPLQTVDYINVPMNRRAPNTSRYPSLDMRPSRTYSLDSKPTTDDFKQNVLTNASDIFRSRTCSAGSKSSLFNRILHHNSGCASTITSPVQQKHFTPHKMEDLIEDDYANIDKLESESERREPSTNTVLNMSEIPYMDMEQQNQTQQVSASERKISSPISIAKNPLRLNHDYVNVFQPIPQTSNHHFYQNCKSDPSQPSSQTKRNVSNRSTSTQTLTLPQSETKKKFHLDNLLSEYIFRNGASKAKRNNKLRTSSGSSDDTSHEFTAEMSVEDLQKNLPSNS